MDPIVRYECADTADGTGAPVATVTMDDGKANALSPRMFEELGAAFDRAEADGAVTVVTGRGRVFSGGFDLGVLTSLTPAAADLLRSGFELSRRLLDFPLPVVAAVNGHAIAMGAFLVLSVDHRVGAAGTGHRLVANEVAIGMTLPHTAIEVCRQRLTPAAFARATNLAEVFSGEAAVAAGFLDAAVAEDEVQATAAADAARFATLDLRAHRETKRRARATLLATLDACIERDDTEFRELIASVGG